jgi:putative heme iron utilization protein
MLMGEVAEVREALVRTAYLLRHPEAEQFVDFADFAFYRIKINRAHLVAGFGRIVDLSPQDILTDVSDAKAMLDAQTDTIAHMNEDHAEACRLYATKLMGAPDGDWRCVAIDPEGIELQNGRNALRLFFPQRVIAPGPLRAVLKQLADQARVG